MIITLDFDGVIHSYPNGWKGAAVVDGPPVPGAMRFIYEASKRAEVNVFSSRSHQLGGIHAMKQFIHHELMREFGKEVADTTIQRVQFPTHKPPSMVSNRRQGDYVHRNVADA